MGIIIYEMENCLKVEKLSFEYPSYNDFSNAQILSELSLKTGIGEITVVFGGAESGKSTLAMILSALVPLHTGGKLSGTAELDGINLTGSDPSCIIEHCGLVFQDPERQTVTTECFDEAAFALESLGIDEDEIKKRVEAAFQSLGISYLLDIPTSETSGGEKKKLALAGLISVDPRLWILDETFEELDNPSKVELFSLLKASGRSILIFSSKYFDIFREADAFYLLNGGELSGSVSFPFPAPFEKKLVDAGIIPDLPAIKSDYPGLPETGTLLQADDLEYSYDNGAFRLHVKRFELKENEVVSIVGRNGCGKSTLARLLCGLAEPQSGTIGAPEPAEAPYLNAFCAYMFQNPDYQIFLPTVYEELAYGLKEAGCSSSVVKARVEKTIEEFKLPNADTPPALMSFSARKRLQAAVYYLLRRPVFILDEADTGLSFRDFIELTVKLKKTSRGLIIITHNLELASAVSDRVLGMSGGRLYENILELSPERINEWLTDSGDMPHDN